MSKEKIYDEMFYRISMVIRGSCEPEKFAEELSTRIVDLEAQVNSLSDMLAEQESKNDQIRILMEQQNNMNDRITKLIDKELLLINNQIVFNNAIHKDLKRLTQCEKHTV